MSCFQFSSQFNVRLPNDHFSIATADAIVRNPHLVDLRCLHCATSYSLSAVHAGCPACRAQGRYVSLCANYVQDGSATHLPYTHGMYLGEGDTPLTSVPELAALSGVGQLHIKDESANPTGSHKDRMSAVGVSHALESGAHSIVLASSGNAAVSAARYAQAAGLACEVATYDGLPAAYAAELDAYGAALFTFADNAGRWNFVRERAAMLGYFALTNYHLPALGSAPLAIEGYKNIAYECQADGYVPDHIMVPTARGDLAWGIYAGFADLLHAGRIQSLPKIWIVEPFARLSLVLQGGSLHGSYAGSTTQFSTAGNTVTYLQWQAVHASAGGAVVVNDAAAQAARKVLATHGIDAELCAAAAYAAVGQLRQQNALCASDKAMCILTANSSKDPSCSATA